MLNDNPYVKMAHKFTNTISTMRIVTEKGWLEPLHPSHSETLFELIHLSRSRLHQWLPWLKRIHSVQDTEAFIGRLIAERGPQFVIRVDEQICGGIGFYVLEEGKRQATLGYWLGEGFTGHGIMRDAMRSICQYGFQHLHLDTIQVRCAANNRRSRNVPENLGFILEGIQEKAEWLTDHYVDHAIYSLQKQEFEIVFDQLLEPLDYCVVSS